MPCESFPHVMQQSGGSQEKRDDATALIGGGATAFMRLGNHLEAEQAANFLGRHHSFVLSGFTATSGGSQSRSAGSSYSYGTAESRGTSVSSNRADEHLLDTATSGSRNRSRDRSANQNWSSSVSQDQSTNWSGAASAQRVYEYRVEPTVLQQLPDHALLLAANAATGTGLVAVESHPAIITFPDASIRPLTPPGYRQHPVAPPVTGPIGQPQIAPRQSQPPWPSISGQPADAQWLLRRQPPRHHG